MPLDCTFLKSAEALEAFVTSWRDGSLPGPDFTHAGHLAACAWLAFDYRGEELAEAMREELIRFNAIVGTPNSPDRGYHETLTIFWCVLVEAAIAGQSTRIEAARHAVTVYGEDKDAANRYYSFDVLKNRQARREWMEPDLAPLPGLPAPPPTRQTRTGPPLGNRGLA